MQNFKRTLATAFMLTAFAVPMLASAETNTGGISPDVQSQIQALLQQIKLLQEQVKTLVASSTTGMHLGDSWKMGSTTGGWMPPGQMGKMRCITLNRSIHIGDSGDDVKSLQDMLKDDDANDFHGSSTGFFGKLTAHAMQMFQLHNGIASSTDGTVGPRTLGFFERKCGKGLGSGQGEDQKGQGKGDGRDDMHMNIMYVRGTIAANNTTNIVVHTDNHDVTVNISASTTIKVFGATSTPPTTGSVSDLTVGSQVGAGGSGNTDGSINAMTIGVGNIPPMGPLMGGPGGEWHPQGMMPTTNGPQHGPGLNGGPQNW